MSSFIKRTTLVRLSTYVSVCVATSLVLAKIVAWKYTHSLSIQASLVDSLLDVLASLVNLFAVHHALQPADKEHRFGHGKAEALAGLGQSGFIAASSLWLVFDGIHHIFEPELTTFNPIGIQIMMFSIVATLGLVSFQHYVVKKTHSLAIAADSLHYRTDFLTNLTVLISLTFGVAFFDTLVGLAIAVYIFKSSWHVGREAIHVLMDHELNDQVRGKLIEIALSHPDVLGVHDLRTRSSGLQSFVQMHVDLHEHISLLEAARIREEVFKMLSERFPYYEILIRADPRNTAECETARKNSHH